MLHSRTEDASAASVPEDASDASVPEDASAASVPEVLIHVFIAIGFDTIGFENTYNIKKKNVLKNQYI